MINDEKDSAMITDNESAATTLEAGVLAQDSALSQEQINKIIDGINISDPTLSVAYGAPAMNGISQFANGLLSQVRAKNAGIVGEQLSDLLMKVKSIDPSGFSSEPSFWQKVPVIGSFIKKAERTIIEYQSVADQVDQIGNKLDQSMVNILRDVENLEQLYEKNHEFYQEISLYLAAGKQKLANLEKNELPSVKAQADASSDPMLAQQVKDLMNKMNRFEKRLHDLELSKVIAFQTAPQIRLIQHNNQALAEKIQSSILTTIPIWKSQIVLALAIDNQRNSTHLQREVTNTTNDLLKKNAELLEMGSIEVAKEVERSIVDLETLKEVQSRLVHTIEETVNIAQAGRTSRLSVEKELVTMEQDLRNRLSDISRR